MTVMITMNSYMIVMVMIMIMVMVRIMVRIMNDTAIIVVIIFTIHRYQ